MGEERNSAYAVLVLAADNAPAHYNLLAAVSNWILLAGFVFFPGTFAALGHSSRITETDAGKTIQNAVGNIPLLVIGCLSCSLGLLGVIMAMALMKKNYVWFANRVFRPGLVNAITALLMMLVNIFTAQNGNWSKTAVAGVAIAATYGALMGFAILILEYYIFKNLKKKTEIAEKI